MISQELLQPPDPPFWTKTSWIQLGYATWVNLSVLGVGLSFGFSAVAVPQLLEPDSAIQLTMTEEALVASVLTLFSPIGCLVSGILMDRWGRKPILVLCHLPIAVGWLYTGFAEKAMDLIIGRTITGVGIGMSMVIPRAYIIEISLPNMRGMLGAFPNIAVSCGVAISAGLGAILKWYVLCWICAVYTTCVMISNCFLPETPFFIIVKGDGLNARNVLKKFRSSNFNIEDELKDLAEFKANNDIHKLSTLETIKVLFSTSCCKPFCISLFNVILTQCAGVTVVMTWTVDMLQKSKSSIDANLGNFVVAITRILCGFTMSVCLYKFGRRSLALISALGVGFASISLGVFLQTYTKESPYPLCFLIAYISFAAHGYYTLPLLMMCEMLPLQVRGILSGMVISILNLSMCGINQIYPTMREELGLANTFSVYGTISLIGAMVLYFILPETKGLTLQEIEEFFNSRRATLISERYLRTLQLQEKKSASSITCRAIKSEGALDMHKEKVIRNSKDRNYEKEYFGENGQLMMKIKGVRDARYVKKRTTEKKEDRDKEENASGTKTPTKPEAEENALRNFKIGNKNDKDQNETEKSKKLDTEDIVSINKSRDVKENKEQTDNKKRKNPEKSVGIIIRSESDIQNRDQNKTENPKKTD